MGQFSTPWTLLPGQDQQREQTTSSLPLWLRGSAKQSAGTAGRQLPQAPQQISLAPGLPRPSWGWRHCWAWEMPKSTLAPPDSTAPRAQHQEHSWHRAPSRASPWHLSLSWRRCHPVHTEQLGGCQLPLGQHGQGTGSLPVAPLPSPHTGTLCAPPALPAPSTPASVAACQECFCGPRAPRQGCAEAQARCAKTGATSLCHLPAPPLHPTRDGGCGLLPSRPAQRCGCSGHLIIIFVPREVLALAGRAWG